MYVRVDRISAVGYVFEQYGASFFLVQLGPVQRTGVSRKSGIIREGCFDFQNRMEDIFESISDNCAEVTWPFPRTMPFSPGNDFRE